MVKTTIMKHFFAHILFYVYIFSIFIVAVFLVYMFHPSFTVPTLAGESIWIHGSTLPNSRTEIVAANLDEAVYVIGGFYY